jgi:hypothetical protein
MVFPTRIEREWGWERKRDSEIERGWRGGSAQMDGYQMNARLAQGKGREEDAAI